MATEALCGLYGALRTGANPEQVTEQIKQFYAQPPTFNALLCILSGDHEEIIKRYAITGVKEMISLHWNAVEDKGRMLLPLFEVLKHSTSWPVTRDLANVLSYLITSELCTLVIQLAESSIETGNPVALAGAAKLIDELLEQIGVENPNVIGIVQKLIVQGMSCAPEIRVEVFALSFHLARIVEYGEFAQIFEASLELVPILGIQDLMRLLSIYEGNLLDREGCPGVNPCKLAELMLPIVNNAGLDADLRRQAFRVLIAILSSFFGELEETAFPGLMHEAAFGLCSSLFQPEDDYEMSPFDIVESLAESFSESPRLIESVLSHLQTIPSGLNVDFYKAIFIEKSLENGIDFYYQSIEQTYQILVPLVGSESACVRGAAMNALRVFCEIFQDESPEIIRGVLEAVWSSFVRWSSSEMLVKTTEVLEASGGCDPIAATAVPFLLQMIGKVSLADQEEALKCLGVIIKTSENSLPAMFQPIVEVLSKVMQVSDDHLSLLKGRAIYCLGRISLKCPEEFSSIAESVAQGLVQNMESNDSYIVLECTNAYGYLLQAHPTSTSSTVQRVVPILMRLGALTDDTARFEVSLPNSVSLADCALSTLCCAVSAYPDAYAANIPEIAELIAKNPSQLALQGVQQILRLNIPSSVGIPLAKVFFSVASTEIQPQVAGLALADIALLVSSCDIGDLYGEALEVAATGLKSELLCQSDKLFIPDIFENAQMIFRETINSLHERAGQLIHPYIPLFWDLAGNQQKEVKNLGIQLLSDVVQNYAAAMDAALLENILKMVCQESEKGNYLGFNCLKSICCAVPQLAIGHSDALMTIFNTAFAVENRGRKKVRMMLDNAVSAFGAFVMNCVGPAFPIDENVTKVLELMPPTDDAEETEYVMTFYEWLLDKAGGQFSAQFAAVLVRLFSDPIDSYEDNCVSMETLTRLLPKLKQLLQSIGQAEQFCRSVLADEEKYANLVAFLSKDTM